MLEIYRRISEEQDLYQRQYEEAAFKVYGTLPARKNFLSGRNTEGTRKQGQNYKYHYVSGHLNSNTKSKLSASSQ